MNNQQITFKEACRKAIYDLAEIIAEEIEKYPENVKPIAYECLYETIPKTINKFCSKPALIKTERVFAYLRLNYVSKLYEKLNEEGIPITTVIDFIADELTILNLDLIIIPQYAITNPELAIKFLTIRLEQSEYYIDIKSLVERVIELSRNTKEFVGLLYLVILFFVNYGYIPDDILDNYGYYLLYLPSKDRYAVINLLPMPRLIYIVYQAEYVLIHSLIGLYYATNNDTIIRHLSNLSVIDRMHIRCLKVLYEYHLIYKDEYFDFLSYEKTIRDVVFNIFRVPNLHEYVKRKAKEFEEPVISLIPRRFTKGLDEYIKELLTISYLTYNCIDLIKTCIDLLNIEYNELAKRYKVKETKETKRVRPTGIRKRLRYVTIIKRLPKNLVIFPNLMTVIYNLDYEIPKILSNLLAWL